MLEAPIAERLGERFPSLKTDTQTWHRLQQTGAAVRVPREAHICTEGDNCSHLALVLQGTARVYKLGESGREITLYRVEAGECCILTASCILSQAPFPAFAVAETDLQGVLIPAGRIRDWMASDPSWRDYLWQLLAHRLSDVIGLVEEVAFGRMDRRIAQYLLRRVATGNGRMEDRRPDSAGELRIQATHQQIAADLGTSREVVSRILKDLEARQVLSLGRGAIRIHNPMQLEQLGKID